MYIDLFHAVSLLTACVCPGFVGEMRAVAMKLHTREQAPKEGKVEAPKQTVRHAWEMVYGLAAQSYWGRSCYLLCTDQLPHNCYPVVAPQCREHLHNYPDAQRVRHASLSELLLLWLRCVHASAHSSQAHIAATGGAC